MSWEVQWSNRANRDLSRLDQRLQRRIVEAIDRFAESGHGDVRPLEGAYRGVFRLRVGDWRVLFSTDRALLVILVLRVLPRGGAYQP